MHTVDVLIPTYKPKKDHLISALKSLQHQTYTNWKALIHDDASGIDIAEMITPFLSDERIIYRKSQCRLGIGGNWNACMSQTHAPFVAFLFQDDCWNERYLEDAMKLLEEDASIGMISMGHEYLFEGMSEYQPLYATVLAKRNEGIGGLHNGKKKLWKWVEQQLSPNDIGEPSFVVMRRENVVKAGPFNESLPQCLDTEFWTRMLLAGDWYDQKGIYGKFRVHTHGASAQNQEQGIGLMDRLLCFDHLHKLTTGDLKKHISSTRKKVIKNMVTKFFKRMRERKKVSQSVKSTVVTYCLRHPLRIICALLS